MIPKDKTLYPLCDAQKLLLWAEIFTLEPKEVKETNVLGYSLKLPKDETLSAEQMAAALEGAFNEVVRNNDSLRLRIIRTLKGMRQYVADYSPCTLERIPVEGDRGFEELLAHSGDFKLDWTHERLLLGKILVLNPHQCGMLLRFHHAAFDGYSVELFFEQFLDAYHALIRGEQPTPAARTYSIVEHFKDDAAYAKSEQHKIDRKFWFNTYNKQRKYSFPAGKRALNGDCKECIHILQADVYQPLVAFAKENNCSLPSLLMTTAALTTYVLTGEENFCIYSLSHGRRKFTLRKTIGCMMNTVPIFYDLEALDAPVVKLITDSYVNYMETFTHARFGMGEQVPLSYKEPIRHSFNFNHGWLLFSVMNYESVFEKSEMEIRDLPMLNQPFQLYASVLEVPGEHIKVSLEYQTAKFTASQVEHMLKTQEQICRMILENPAITPRQIRRALNPQG